jgi:hypothetical protein
MSGSPFHFTGQKKFNSRLAVPTVSQTQIPSLVAEATGEGFELLRGNGGLLWRHESRD